jgi:hypothetical protein
VRSRVWIFVGLAVVGLWLAAASHRGPAVASEGVALAVAVGAGYVIALVAAGVTLVLAHELGHAVAGVLLTPGRPLIEIGEPPRDFRFSIGRIDVNLSPGIGGGGHCRWPTPALTRRQIVLIAAAGPAASLALAALLVYFAVRLDPSHGGWRVVLAMLALTALVQGVGSLVPWRGHKRDDSGKLRVACTDGQLILAALRRSDLTHLLPLREKARAPARRLPATPAASSRAQQVLAAACAVAKQRGDHYVSTTHLLGALGAADTRLAQLPRTSAVPPRATHQTDEPRPLPATPALRRAIARAHNSLSLTGHAAIEPDHLVLALLEDPASSAYEALVEAGVDIAALRMDILRTLGQG